MTTTPNKPKRKLNPLLLQVLIISALIHVFFLLGFGGYTVYKHVQRSETQFEQAPPPVEAPAPPPQNVEVLIQRPPQQQVPQSSMRELRVQQVGNIAVAAVTANVPSMQESFSVSSGTGLAGAMGGVGDGKMNVGDVAGNLGLGISELNVFGISDKGERILFMIDAGRNMLTDDKGGMHSYNAIKDELIRLIGGLSAGTLYNVMLYEFNAREGARIEAFQPTLVSSSPANLERLKQWLMPVNRDAGKLGIRKVNVKVAEGDESEIGRILGGKEKLVRADMNSHYIATMAALEQNVDLVYVISSEWRGLSNLARPDTAREAADWERRINSQPYQRQLAEHTKEREEMAKRVAEMEKEANETRRKNGQPPIVFRHGWLDEKMRYFKLSYKVPHPGHKPQHYMDSRPVQGYFTDQLKTRYRDKDLQVPRFNFIMFMAENGSLSSDQRNNLRDFTRFFGGGRFRELKGLPEIKNLTGTPAK